MALYFYLLIVFLLAAFYFDARIQKIPNWLTVTGVVAGLFIHVIRSGFAGLKFSFYGIIVGFVIMFVLYLAKAIGAGDVKLFAAIGALTGVEFSLYGIMYSIIYAGLIGVVLLLVRREFVSRTVGLFLKMNELKEAQEKGEVMEEYKKKEVLTFPFMYAVIPGIATTYYYVIL